MKTAILGFAVAFVATPAFAANPQVQTIQGPIQHVTYNLASQTYTTTPTKATSATPVYDNTAFNGSFYAPGVLRYDMDWGTLAAAPYNCITAFTLGYGTSELVGPSVRIRFFEGATGFGVQGTLIETIDLTGLPPSTSGTPQAFAVTIDLKGSGLCFDLADGPIGYAYEFFDASTGPLLCGPPNETGVIDAIDNYDATTDLITQTFFFGGVPFASLYMDLTGHESYIPFGTACLGSGGFAPNLALSGCPCPGNDVTVDITSGNGGSNAALVVAGATGALPMGSCTLDVSAPFFLIFLGALPGAGAGNGAISFSSTIPATVTTATAFLQAVVDDSGNLITSNGVQIDIP